MRVTPLLLVVVLLFIGCTIQRAPLPETGGRILGAEEANKTVNTLLQEADVLQGMKGLARARIVKGDEKVSLRYAVVFQTPDKLRIETFPVNGFYTLGLLTAHDGALVALDTTAKLAVRGTAGIPLIRSATGIPADLSELMAVVSGRVVAATLEQLRSDQDLIVVELPGGDTALFSHDRRYYWRYSTAAHEMREVQIRDQFRDDLSLKVSYGEYNKVGGVSVPRVIEIAIPREDATVSLTLSSLTINPSLSLELFSQVVPSDYSVVERP